jgi:hypothetical protein
MEVYIYYNNGQVFSKSVTAYREASGYYRYTGSMSYTSGYSGNYQLSIKFTCSDTGYSGSTMYMNGNVRIEYTVEHQTVIGLDGMCSTMGTNKNFWVGQDGIRMQWGANGLRFSGNKAGNAAMDVAVKFTGSSGVATHTQWFPFYNYVPLFKPQWSISVVYIPHMKESKYVYQINPETDAGYCYIDFPPYDNSFNKQQGWILLPDTYWYHDGVPYTLPAGYRVRIINSTSGDNAVDIYVTTKNDLSSSQTYYNGRQCVIWDDNRNPNVYSELNDAQRMNDEFLWDGYVWRQLRDTQ